MIAEVEKLYKNDWDLLVITKLILASLSEINLDLI